MGAMNSTVNFLLLGKGDLHGVGGGNFEALQRLLGSRRLHLVLKLHEGNVVPTRHQTHLFEPWEPANASH